MKRYAFALLAAGLMSAGSFAQAPAEQRARAELEQARAELAKARQTVAEMEKRLAQKAQEDQPSAEQLLAAKLKMIEAARKAELDARRQAESQKAKAEAAALQAKDAAEAAGFRLELSRKKIADPAEPKTGLLKAEGKPITVRLNLADPAAPQDVLLTVDRSEATPLVRRTHAVTKDKAEKLMAFFKEFAGDQILEAKFEKGGLVTTTTTELDQLLVGLVALSNGQKPGKVGLGGAASERVEVTGRLSFDGKVEPLKAGVTGSLRLSRTEGEKGETLFLFTSPKFHTAEGSFDLTAPASKDAKGKPLSLDFDFVLPTPAVKPAAEVVPVKPNAK